MKTIVLSLLLSFFGFLNSFAQSTYTISISGLTFTPADITVNIGDTVFFNGSSSHPVLEVSSSTWNSDGNTPLAGGFEFPSGVGKITFDSEGTHYYVCENHYTSGMKGKINVSQTTSINNKITSNDISIYPNPLINSNLYIQVSNSRITTVNCKIYDLTGKSIINVYQNVMEGRVSVDCAVLTPGVYIVQLISLNNTLSYKLIKQ